MRGLMILLALGLASSDKLDRTYLPPPGAKLSGGNLGAVDVPLELPNETPSTTIRPRPKYPVRPEDTELTVGINRGQPSLTGAPQGFTSTKRPFASTYIPSTTPASIYTQSTTPEGFGITVTPTGSTGLPSERPGQKLRPVYGPTGQVIGVTPTPGSVEICEEGDAQCQQGQRVSPVYGPNGEIVGQQVTPTPGSVQGLRPVYGTNGEIIGVTSTPGTVEICKEGDVSCQKRDQQNVPVYGPSGQIVGYQPGVTPTPGTAQGLGPVYGQNGEIIGVTPTTGTVEICKVGDIRCQQEGKQNIPVYGPSSLIIGYQPSVTSTPGTTQSFRPVYGQNGEIIGVTPTPETVEICKEGDVSCQKRDEQTVPVYGPSGQIVGYQPSVTPTPGTTQGLRAVYGQNGEIIGVTPTTGTVEICKEGDVRCQQEGKQNIPVYGPSSQIIGYQPSVTSTPGTTQGLRPVYGQNGEIIGVTPTPETVEICKEGDVSCQKRDEQTVPVYGPSGQIVGYQPGVTPTPGTTQGLRPVYGQNGEIFGVKSTPETVEICKEGDVNCQNRDQQNVPVYGPSGQIVGYQPSVTPTPGTTQGLRPIYGQNGEIIGVTPTTGTVDICKEGDVRCQKRNQQNIPVYGPSGQIVGYQPSVTPTPGKTQGLRPVYGKNGEIIGVTPTPETVEICKEGNVNCQKRDQQNVPVHGSSGQIIEIYQPNVTPTPETTQDLHPVYGQNGEIIGVTPTPGTVESVYGRSGQIVGYQPNVTLTSGSVQGLHPVYGQNGEVVGVTSAPVTQKQSQINVPVYGPSGQIIGYQPSMSPTSESVQGLRPVYGQNGEIISLTPTSGSVRDQGQNIIPVYGTDGQIIGYKPNVITIGTDPSLQPVHGSSGHKPVTSTPGTVKICKEGDVICQKQDQPNVLVYDPRGQIVGYQPSVTISPGTQQGVRPVYGLNGEIIGVTPTPEAVEVCQEGDTRCQKTAQENVPVYDSTGKIIGYQPSVIPTPGILQGSMTQQNEIVPIYGSNGQVIGYQPNITPTIGSILNLQPVYDTSGQIIGQQPGLKSVPGTVKLCKDGDIQCLKQAQQNVPVYGHNEQIVRYQPSVTPSPSPGIIQGASTPGQQIIPVYGINGQIIGFKPSVIPISGTLQGSVTKGPTTIPVYGTNGQIVGYQPSVTSTPVTSKGLQSVYDTSGQIIRQQPISTTVQVCREGDVQCLKQTQQNVSIYGPSGQIIGYQPSATPGLVQGLQPVYNSNGIIVGQRPAGRVQDCIEGDEQCQKQAQQYVPVYGGQVIGKQPSVTPTPGTVEDLQLVYGPTGQIVGQLPVTTTPSTVQTCQKGDVQCQRQVLQIRPVYGPSGQIIGQQVTPTPGTIPSLQPVYGPSGQIIGQQPTQVSTTTGKPIIGGTQNIYRPGSTMKPSVTTPGYFPSSLVSTNLPPFQNYGTTPAGFVITPAGSNTERPLAESDRKAVTINYDNMLTPEGYSYNFDTSNGIHVGETGVVTDGNKAVGTYSYIGDDGKQYQVTYKADENGFQPTGAHLPTPHPIPADIQRVIEQAVKDKQAGISDDGSYDEGKYGHEKYDRPYRPQSGDRQRPTSGPKQSKPNHAEEGYHYTPPKSKFPPHLPGRDQTKRPQEIYEDKSTTPNINIGKVDDDVESGVLGPSHKSNYRPSGGQESGITTYRPTGFNKLGQVDKYGRPIPLRPGQGVGSTTFRPSVSPQAQVDKYGRPISSQRGQGPVGIVEPGQVDKYGRPLATRPGQGYSSTTYRPAETTEPSQVDQYGKPTYSQPDAEPSGTAEPGQVDQYGRPVSSRPTSSQPIQVDVFGFTRPVYSQQQKETSRTVNPEKEDKYGRPILSRPGQSFSTTTYRPVGTTEPGQVGEYGRPIPSTSRPAQEYVDKFGRPIYFQPKEEPSGTAEPGQADKYGRPIPSRPGQNVVSTTYRPTGTVQPTQEDKFGRLIHSNPGEEPVGTAEPSQVDKFGRPIPARPRQEYSPSTSRPTEYTGSALLDAFGRPISTAPSQSPETTQPGQVDKYGRPGQRPTYRPIGTTQTEPVDEYGRPTSYVTGEPAGSTLSPEVDIYGRPISLKPGQGPSSTTYRPVSSTQAPGYQPSSEVFEGPGQKPEEFGPREKQGPAYLSPFEYETGKLIREDFRGPKQPPRFDSKTGYHY